jgi:F-type H+-transporting ATPase subunit a
MHEARSVFYGLVNPWWEKTFGWAVPDHVLNGLFVLLLLAVTLPFIRRMILRSGAGPVPGVPSRFQQVLEMITGGFMELLEDNIGHGYSRGFLAITGAFALFIFLCNMSGLFFFLNPATSNVNTTFALSITAFLLYNLQGVGKHGAKYVKQFMGPMLAVAVIIFPVEIISHLVRAVSLGLRLFGNVYGEHTVTGSISGLAAPFTYIFAPWPVMLLGIIAGTMQTFIFVMLFMVYVGGALAEEH